MPKPSSRNIPHLIFLCWLLDALFAGLFAYGLAGSVGALVAGKPFLLPLLALVTAGAGRAVAQGRASILGMQQAHREKQRRRAELLPTLLRTSYQRSRPVGEDMALVVDAIESTEGFHARFQPLKRASATVPFVIAGLVAFVSPVSAGILLATLLPFGVGMAVAGIMTGKVANRQLAAITRLNALFFDRLRALPEIRLFQAEEKTEAEITDAAQAVSHHTLTLLRTAFLSSSVIDFFAAMAIALVAIYTGFGLLGLLPFRAPESFTLEKVFFALTLAPEFYAPFRRLAAAYHDRQQNSAAEEALDTLLAEIPPAPAPAAPYAGLRVEGLRATHHDGPTVGPISFALGKSGLVALTGPTGAGKSTLLAAIAGLLPHEGSLLWAGGGAPEIAWSGQQVLIVSGTLSENIALWAEGTPDVAAAAKRADLGKLLEDRGLDAAIDWRGSGLSGGERRRIGLARALATGRPLILLDEPTADLDPDTAKAIAATIRAMASQHAVLVATHDASLAALADEVIAL